MEMGIFLCEMVMVENLVWLVIANEEEKVYTLVSVMDLSRVHARKPTH